MVENKKALNIITLEKLQVFNKCLSHRPVDWLVDAVVSVCAEQQGPPTGHGASSRHPIQKVTQLVG